MDKNMIFQNFASGSSGNCTLVGSDDCRILIDAGISRKRTADALENAGMCLDDLDGIFLTHEHTDHIQGLPMIAKKTSMPIYATEGTIAAVLKKYSTIDPQRFVAVQADDPVTLKDLTINPMKISHDAAEPVAYRIEGNGKKACICTDLGCYSDYTVQCLMDSDVLLLEANHDVNMLQVGPYPYRLKQRILGDHGHLSNLTSGELLTKVLNNHMKAIFLGHLSQENNYPDLAFETVRLEVMEESGDYRADDLPIGIARRQEVSPAVEF
jgi:phosphoribosyl 1,2-cyclic phosphodiesterase